MQMKKFLLLNLLMSQLVCAWEFSWKTPVRKEKLGIPEKIAEKRAEQKPAEPTKPAEVPCKECPRSCSEVLKELELEEANEQEYKRHKEILDDENRKEELTEEQYHMLEAGARKYNDFDTFEKVMRWRLEVKSTEKGEVAIEGTPRMMVALIATIATAGGAAVGYTLKHYKLI